MLQSLPLDGNEGSITVKIFCDHLTPATVIQRGNNCVSPF